jgi:hypothetical protein
MIDMDISALPLSLSTSPVQGGTHIISGAVKKTVERTSPIVPTVPTIKEDGNDLFARKAGLGNLMKSAKKDVQVPDFDMNAFL